MKKLKIGVFGGYRGKTMINILLHHEDAELVAVCDKYEPLLEDVRKSAEEAGCPVACYRDFDAFLQHDMDAVVLANYANEHAVYAVRCLRAGKHVLSEVLPCETMAQAVELIETVEATGLVYAYAENYCYMRHTFEMWRRYKTGEIGEITYGEGEYIHDCSAIWPQITYGERDHWRNRMHPNFYCTHSLGPLLAISGLRPVRVVGFETVPNPDMKELGFWHGAGLELVTLENGAVLKSIHGGLKREPGSVNYEVYGQKGMMESGRLEPLKKLNIYKEGEHRCQGEWSIDVYTAVDMGICGILAYRSVLGGGIPVAVPDLRDPAQREAYRYDNACTTPGVAGDQLLPRSSFGDPDIPDSVYAHVRQLWEEGRNA